MSGPRVGTPAPFQLVAAAMTGGLVCWLLAAAALLRAAPELAHGFIVAPDVLLAVHLVGLGFLPLAISGGALHILPTLLRNSGSPRLGWIGFAGLCAGPLLAVGIARHRPELTWAAVVLVGVGAAALLVELGQLVACAPHDRLLLASRFGIAVSAVSGLLAFLLGPILFAHEWRPWLGVPHDRLIAIHLHLAVLGWLSLLIVAVGRTLAPMLALAPSEAGRRLPLEEIVLSAGVWLAVAGFALGSRPLLVLGYAASLGASIRFGIVLARAARRNRLPGLEGPLAHFAAGVLFLIEAAVLALVLLSRSSRLQVLAAYVLLLLLGWAGGVTLGHVGKLLSLSAWTWWPPGPRPKQADLYDRRSWLTSATTFALGTQLLVVGTLAAEAATARVGAALLIVSALAALYGAMHTLTVAWPAISGRAQVSGRTQESSR